MAPELAGAQITLRVDGEQCSLSVHTRMTLLGLPREP